MADLIDRQAAVLKAHECLFAQEVAAFEEFLELIPAVDAVPRDVLEQIRWERDIAIEQLKSYGVSFGEKADCAKVVRCKDCKHGEVDDPDFPRQHYCHEGCGWNDADFFCAYGERREDNGVQ